MRDKAKKIATLCAVLVAALGIIGYSLWRTFDLIEGPLVIIDSPRNGETVDNSLVVLEGEARRVTGLKLNGRDIFVDRDGRFREVVLLSYGYNALTLSAIDRFGRHTLRKMELIYK